MINALWAKESCDVLALISHNLLQWRGSATR